MKFAAKILLVLFLSFQAMPTIITVIRKHCDTSCFYSMSEEEIKSGEYKADLTLFPEFEFTSFAAGPASKILSENLSRHDNAAPGIFCPPPELS